MVTLREASDAEITQEIRRREEEEVLNRRKKLLEDVESAIKENRIISVYRDTSEDKLVYHMYISRK